MSATRTQQQSQVTSPTVVSSGGIGAIGGLVGGMAFGMMMQLMGFIPMIAALVGSESVAVGWVVHIAISVIFGIGFGLATQQLATSWGPMLGAGLGYGVLLWVVGPLLLMPAKLGMPLFAPNSVAWQSLMGHMIFGLVLAAVTVALTRSRN